jgi:hypothetical protein
MTCCAFTETPTECSQQTKTTAASQGFSAIYTAGGSDERNSGTC